ncbi:MAG TPA: malectin domain-containing carbohydrate-binding protein [Bryobacteraceae bacterium]|nr:malectin domain-containing carbohydrate-binding protein [Bryobacteraceae bacterium]
MATKYLEGATEVKEYQIGVEVLSRPPTFDPAEDASARVEAHRLRKRLREFYETEGRNHRYRIEMPLGHYAIVIQPLTAEVVPDEKAAEPGSSPVATITAAPGNRWSGFLNYRFFGLAVLVVAILTAALVMLARRGESSTPPVPARASSPAAAPAPVLTKTVPPQVATSQTSIRIACGRTQRHTDRWGEMWEADRDFEGGTTFEASRQYIARAYDPKLFQAGRTGNFTYRIPLAPGVYELHLYFMEGIYGPAMPAGGGEISRLFEIQLNGQTLLSRFDIYSDAGGTNVADMRVFKDVSPGPGGILTLAFIGQTGLPLLNAIEIVPAAPHHLNPIRIVAQEGFYTDSSGNVWKPDRYYMGGQTASHALELRGTRDPDLFARERYGHFDYAIPVDKGTYQLSLYFAEEYFGGGNMHTQVGTRVFDVTCNGISLLHDFDLLKEAGFGQAVVKTFHGLKPSGQGTLLVSFTPVHDYASLYAIEVIDESN